MSELYTMEWKGDKNMNEKSKLLALFEKAAIEADEVRKARQETMASAKLTDEGKSEIISKDRETFIKETDKYREEMLKIVNDREEDYTAFYVRAAKTRMNSSDYQTALSSNLKALQSGHMGKIEIMAMLEIYAVDNKDDLAVSRIYEVMRETHNPHFDLIEDRITVHKQLNAFASIRNIINSKINIGLVDLPGWNAVTDNKEYFYYGSGYYAIVNELNDDLSLNCAEATLGRAANANERNRIHYGESFQNKGQDNGISSGKEHAKEPDTVMIHKGASPVAVNQLTGGKAPRVTA